MASDARVVRPFQGALAVLSAFVLVLVASIVAAAVRRGEWPLAWLGVGFGLLFLPVAAWYRSEIRLEPGGLRLKGFQREMYLPYAEIEAYGRRSVSDGTGAGSTFWLTILGRGGQRLDAALNFMPREDGAALMEALAERAPQARRERMADPSQLRLVLVAAGVALILFFSACVFGAFGRLVPGSDRLLNVWAAAGLALGLALGCLVGRRLLPRSPAGGLAAVAMSAMAALPAAALFWVAVLRLAHR